MLDCFCTNQTDDCGLFKVVLDVRYGDSYNRSIDYIYKWVHSGFKPPNLSVIIGCYDTKMHIKSWPN